MPITYEDFVPQPSSSIETSFVTPYCDWNWIQDTRSGQANNASILNASNQGWGTDSFFVGPTSSGRFRNWGTSIISQSFLLLGNSTAPDPVPAGGNGDSVFVHGKVKFRYDGDSDGPGAVMQAVKEWGGASPTSTAQVTNNWESSHLLYYYGYVDPTGITRFGRRGHSSAGAGSTNTQLLFLTASDATFQSTILFEMVDGPSASGMTFNVYRDDTTTPLSTGTYNTSVAPDTGTAGEQRSSAGKWGFGYFGPYQGGALGGPWSRLDGASAGSSFQGPSIYIQDIDGSAAPPAAAIYRNGMLFSIGR